MCLGGGGVVSAMTQCRWGGQSTKQIQDYFCESLQLLYTVLWNSSDVLSHDVIILLYLDSF